VQSGARIDVILLFFLSVALFNTDYVDYHLARFELGRGGRASVSQNSMVPRCLFGS